MTLARTRRDVLRALGALGLAGCGRGGGSAGTERELVVFAASSLGEAFRAMEPSFVASRPGVTVSFQLAGSQELRTQIEHGAPCDVFASADTTHMEALQTTGRVSDPRVFAHNEPVVVVASDRRDDIRTFADLARVRRVVVGDDSVPIGRYTKQILLLAEAALGAQFRADVESHVVSRELNVKQVLAKVVLGEADAGIVYCTDVRGVDRIGVVTIPRELNVVASYPIAVTTGAAHPGLARAFVELVLSQTGQGTLASQGFIVPSPAPT